MQRQQLKNKLQGLGKQAAQLVDAFGTVELKPQTRNLEEHLTNIQIIKTPRRPRGARQTRIAQAEG